MKDGTNPCDGRSVFAYCSSPEWHLIRGFAYGVESFIHAHVQVRTVYAAHVLGDGVSQLRLGEVCQETAVAAYSKSCLLDFSRQDFFRVVFLFFPVGEILEPQAGTCST